MDKDTSVDHECVAIHCPACCPVNQAFNDGWQTGSQWSEGMTELKGRDVIITGALIIIAVATLAAIVMEIRSHDNP